MILRGARVFARTNEQGELIKSPDGRVEVRYKASDSRAYRAAERNLERAEDDALLPDDACAPAQPSGGGGGSGSGGSGSGTPQDKRDKKAAAATRAAARTYEPGTIIVYADGACSGNPGPAGIGVVVQDGPVRRELSKFLGVGTNNIAELTAILEAVLVVDEPSRPVRIHTDSKYSIGVLSMGWKAKANQELIARVKQAMKRLTDLELIHVPGHAGVLLNERADVLAVQAVKTEQNPGWVVYEGKPGPV
ncbi:MAG: Ribonuclease [Pseudomonadota bacterium]|jgi:ribonuclease HI